MLNFPDEWSAFIDLTEFKPQTHHTYLAALWRGVPSTKQVPDDFCPLMRIWMWVVSWVQHRQNVNKDFWVTWGEKASKRDRPKVENKTTYFCVPATFTFFDVIVSWIFSEINQSGLKKKAVQQHFERLWKSGDPEAQSSSSGALNVFQQGVDSLDFVMF